MLSESERQCLLQLARRAIEAAVVHKEKTAFIIDSSDLQKPCGAFVTLRKSHDLRGCIGYVDPRKPLIETVQDAAVRAALEDPRFPPVMPDELGEIDIEISVLSLLTGIASATEIEVGKHGLVVELGNHRGLLLPQVAAEYGWDAETLLHQTIRKAGLPPGVTGQKDLRLFVFTAEIFGEHHTTLA